MKLLLKILLLFILIIAAWLGYRVYDNNKMIPMPDQSSIQKSFDNGIKWLLANRETILEDTNTTLWSMLDKASKINKDPRLVELVDTYLKRHDKRLRNNFWGQLFYEDMWVPVSFERMGHLPEYNQYFAYALTCDEDLAKQPEIKEQNDAEFCNKHRLRPACVTHQMMGILLLERKHCETEINIPSIKKILQNRIERQLTWDPRGVVDVYLQRALMLNESGASNKVKPIWVSKIIGAQRADGGWSDSQPILRVGNKHLSFGGRGLIFRPLKSNLHATAQGIHLMSMLLDN